jgi:hypothetical protein
MSFMQDETDQATELVGVAVVIGLGVSLFCGCGVFIIPAVIAWQMGRYNRSFWDLQLGLIMLGLAVAGLYVFVGGFGTLWDIAFGHIGQAILIIVFCAISGAVYLGIYSRGQQVREEELAAIEARKTQAERKVKTEW